MAKMAATSAGRVLTLCRQFHNAIRISAPVPARHTALNFTNTQSCLIRQTSPVLGLPWRCPSGVLSHCRPLHTSAIRRGLDEFFDLPENWGESTVKSGAPWTAKLLRAKSNEDLHKLWYVLLKEKNMLNTVEQESKRQRVQMPSPERLKKVERSLRRLDTVVTEREDALRSLQTGQETGRPGAWRKSVFGYVYWYRFREHAIPWYMNRRYKRKRFYTPPFVAPHMRLRLEKRLRSQAREASLQKNKQAKLMERFPHMKVQA